MKKRVLGAMAPALLAMIAVAAMPSAASASTRAVPRAQPVQRIEQRRGADLSLVHGIPGVDVDIYVVKNFFSVKVLRNVHFGTAADLTTAYPGWVTPGFYLVDVVPAGASPFKPLLLTGFSLGSQQSKTVAAYVSADAAGAAGQPRLGVFTNDLSPTNGQARVTVRHLAVAPTVGVYANGAVAVTPAFSNGQSATAVVPAATYDVTVTAPNSPQTVLADIGGVSLAADTNTLAFAIGTYPATFTVATLTIPTKA